jgi:hypothetical protein
MKTVRDLHVSFLLSAVLALLSLCAARAEDATSQYKFSDPAKPGILKIRIGRGDLVVRAGDGQAIAIHSDSEPREQAVGADGLRVLTEASGYSFAEKNNVATFECGIANPGKSSDCQITVPRSTAVVVNNVWGGDITCSGISGDLDIRSLNGEVRLDDISGGALVESTNGGIRATIREVHEGRPISFTSVNGTVSIRVPVDAKANVRLRTQNGEIKTDFDEKALVTKVELAQPYAARRAHTSSGDGADSDVNGRSPEEDARLAAKEARREAELEADQAKREAREAQREALALLKEDAAESGGRVAIPPIPPLPTMTGGKTVTGTLNGGGPEIQAMTVNGDVILRKAADQKK